MQIVYGTIIMSLTTFCCYCCCSVKAHQLSTNIPQSFSYSIIESFRVVWLLDLAVRKVFPTQSHHLVTHGTINGCLCPLPWRLAEYPLHWVRKKPLWKKNKCLISGRTSHVTTSIIVRCFDVFMVCTVSVVC